MSWYYRDEKAGQGAGYTMRQCSSREKCCYCGTEHRLTSMRTVRTAEGIKHACRPCVPVTR